MTAFRKRARSGVARPGASARPAALALSGIGVGSGFVTLLSTWLPNPPGFATTQVRLVGVSVVVIAVLIQLVPWRQFSVGATLGLMPLAFSLISWHNYAGGADPFRYGIFYLTVFLWLGLFHPRGTSLWWAPLAAVSYVVPLLARGEPAYAVATVAYAVPVYVATAELLAARSRALAKTEERLRHMAERDALTGLANRTVFVQELERAGSRGRPGVVFIDIDDFKQINDRHGHAVGDEVLRQAAAAIRGAVRDDDLVARLAGDEFGVLLRGIAADDDTTGPAVAEAVLERLRWVKGPDGLMLRASAGVAFGARLSADALIARADDAMYVAKRGGKDTVALAG